MNLVLQSSMNLVHLFLRKEYLKWYILVQTEIDPQYWKKTCPNDFRLWPPRLYLQGASCKLGSIGRLIQECFVKWGRVCLLLVFLFCVWSWEGHSPSLIMPFFLYTIDLPIYQPLAAKRRVSLVKEGGIINGANQVKNQPVPLRGLEAFWQYILGYHNFETNF